MRSVLLTAIKDLRRLRRDPIGIVVWIGVPVFIAVLLLTTFGRGGEARPRGLLLIADLDQTFISSMIPRAYRQGALAGMISVEAVTLDDGRRRIGRGDGSALLIIPKGFSDAFFRNEPARLELLTNPSQTILPGIITEVTSVLLDGAFYAHKLIGDDLRQFGELTGPPPDELLTGSSVRIRDAAIEIRKYLDPPVIALATEVIETGPRRAFNMAAMFFPSFVFMAVLFFTFGMANDIWKERLGGTLRRVTVTPLSPAQFLAGKTLAIAAVCLTVAAVGVAVGMAVLGIEVRHPVLAALWAASAGCPAYLAAVLIQTHASTARTANVLANFTMMILAMLGGSFFPFEAMPAFLRRIGERTPNGWALLQFRSLLDGETGVASLAVSFAMLALVSGAVFWLVQRRLRRGFAA